MVLSGPGLRVRAELLRDVFGDHSAALSSLSCYAVLSPRQPSVASETVHGCSHFWVAGPRGPGSRVDRQLWTAVAADKRIEFQIFQLLQVASQARPMPAGNARPNSRACLYLAVTSALQPASNLGAQIAAYRSSVQR